MKKLILSIFLLTPFCAFGQVYETVYPSFNPVPYTGIFHLSGQIYRVGLHNIIEVSSNNGDSWQSLTPSIRRFNIIQATSSDNYALALLEPMRFAPDNWDDSTHTSVMLFTKDSSEPELLQIPWFVERSGLYRKLFCNVASDALFASQIGQEQMLLRSTDEGVTWESLTLPNDIGSPHFPYFYNRDRGILVAPADGFVQVGDVFVTHDAGATWTDPGRRTSMRTDGYQLIVSPLTWLSADTVLLIDENNVTQMSTDGGVSWRMQAENLSLPIINSIVMDRTGVGYYACADGSIIRTEDFGKNAVRIRQKSYINGPSQRVELCSPGPSRVLCVNQCGEAFHSIDGGISWINEKVHTMYNPEHFQLLSEDRAYVRMYAADHEYRRGAYLGTTDGGATWKTVYDIDKEGKDWSHIVFATPTVWYAVRKPDESDSTVILRTSDSGTTWSQVFSGNIGNTFVGGWRGKYTVGADTMWLPCSAGVFATDNGGQTWSKLNVSLEMTGRGAIDISEYPNCYAISKSKIAVSNDGGMSWRSIVEAPQTLDAQGIILTGEGMVYLHYQERNSWRWKLLKSTDAGAHWDSIDVIQYGMMIGNIDQSGNSYGFGSLGNKFFISSTDEWRSYSVEGEFYGYLGYGIYSNNYDDAWVTTSFSILKTTNGGINWTNVTPSLPLSPRILSTWPQPVSQGGMMSTELDLTRPGPVRIELHDLLGRRRAVVLETEVAATRRIVQWSTLGLERGVYVLRLVTGSGVANAKVMVE